MSLFEELFKNEKSCIVLAACSFAILVFVCPRQAESQILVKTRPFVSDTLNVFKSSGIGIGFRYDQGQKVKLWNDDNAELMEAGKPIIMINAFDLRYDFIGMPWRKEKDPARFIAEYKAVESLRADGDDGTTYARVDSMTEFINPSGLRIFVGYRTRVSEFWGSDSTSVTYEKATPIYYVDLVKSRIIMVELRWQGDDSLAVPKMLHFIDTVFLVNEHNIIESVKEIRWK